MANSRERLRPGIQLTSPEGEVFNAFWRGDPRSQSKKVGIFNFPNVNGSSVQDLATASMTYTLTIFFQGEDHDLDSDSFMKALQQKGVWEVIHPVHGLKKLQPLIFTPDDQPIDSIDITKVDTEWIEPLDLVSVPSASELQASVASQIEEFNSVAADQLEQSTFQDTVSEATSFREAVLDAVASVKDKLQVVSDFSADITAEIESIQRDVNAVLAVVPLDILAVAGQLQELIQLPARAINSIEARLNAYLNFTDDITFSLTPDTPGTSSYNRVAVQELCQAAALAAVSDVSSSVTPGAEVPTGAVVPVTVAVPAGIAPTGTGAIISRAEAIGIIETNIDLFKDITDALDQTQDLFKNQAIDVQYFSQSQSYPVAALLNALTVAYLLRATFDLKTEKRFILERSRNPVMVAIEEYGSPGENDSNIDLFLDSNKIQGDEHLIMSKGRELVVYV